MEPQRESYCIGESARADFAAKTDACARGALLLAAVPCGCVAIREGVRTITAKNWGERAGHFAKAVGWAAVGSGAAWLATTAPFLGGSVDQYGIACQGPKAR